MAEVCHIHNITYLCWSVDCPLLELFDKAIQYTTNRIFLFDRAQYEYFYPFNPNCIYYLPLAANIDRFDYAIQSITAQDKNKYSLVEVRLHTGRTHQVRVQFASRKHPLWGDGKYGSRVKGDIALWCARIAFSHPKDGKRMSFSLDVPEGWALRENV